MFAGTSYIDVHRASGNGVHRANGCSRTFPTCLASQLVCGDTVHSFDTTDRFSSNRLVVIDAVSVGPL